MSEDTSSSRSFAYPQKVLIYEVATGSAGRPRAAAERRAVDAVFRALPVIVLEGYARPLLRVSDYLDLLERSTYDGTTRVR